MPSIITVIVYNGLCNRLLPIISALRLRYKMKEKYTLNIIWTHTPGRSCLAYHGELCALDELYQINKIDNFEINSEYNNYNKTYEFQYWLAKDHIIDTINDNGNIFINYALYPLLSIEDDVTSPFINTKTTLSKPGEIVFDNVGLELSSIIQELKPREELQIEIEKLQKSFKKNMIGLHLRKSDGGFVNNKWNDIVKTLIGKCKEWCSADMENNGVYLATDDQDIYIEFLLKLGKNLCSYNPPDELCLCSSQFNNKFNNDKYNVLVAVVELHSFSKCNKLIIGTVDSTFSLCAMLLSSELSCRKYLINDVSNIPEMF